MFSDSYPIKLVDGLFYEVEGKTIKESGDIDEALIGGNKATDATEEDESVDSSVITGIIQTHFRKIFAFDFEMMKLVKSIL